VNALCMTSSAPFAEAGVRDQVIRTTQGNAKPQIGREHTHHHKIAEQLEQALLRWLGRYPVETKGVWRAVRGCCERMGRGYKASKWV